MIYPSKKDRWLVATVFLGGIVLFAMFLISLYRYGIAHHETLVLFLTVLFYSLILRGLAWPVYYEIARGMLHIRSGILHYKIPLSTILQVRPSRNPLSSPAWSLDRLRIDYSKDGKVKYLLISPEERKRFIFELMAADPALILMGEELKRKRK